MQKGDNILSFDYSKKNSNNTDEEQNTEESKSESCCNVDTSILGEMNNGEDSLADSPETRDIIKEVEIINQQMRDQRAYQKTKLWHQQSAEDKDFDQANQLIEITERLTRIEEKLDDIAKMLKL